jgi:hypothetical protein
MNLASKSYTPNPNQINKKLFKNFSLLSFSFILIFCTIYFFQLQLQKPEVKVSALQVQEYKTDLIKIDKTSLISDKELVIVEKPKTQQAPPPVVPLPTNQVILPPSLEIKEIKAKANTINQFMVTDCGQYSMAYCNIGEIYTVTGISMQSGREYLIKININLNKTVEVLNLIQL